MGALESPALIGGAALTSGVATGIFMTMKKDIYDHFMTSETEGLKALKDVKFLIYIVGAYTLALSLALLASFIPWAGVVGITVANVLLVAKLS
jgi:ABC-type lipoprotein release transport system permease subunit